MPRNFEPKYARPQTQEEKEGIRRVAARDRYSNREMKFKDFRNDPMYQMANKRVPVDQTVPPLSGPRESNDPAEAELQSEKEQVLPSSEEEDISSDSSLLSWMADNKFTK